MRGWIAALGVALIAALSACGGGGDEPAAGMPAVWSAPRDTGHVPAGLYVAVRLGDGSVALLQQVSDLSPQGTHIERVELVIRDDAGRETARRELHRVDAPSCCWWLPTGLRMVADGRGGAFLGWNQGRESAPYREMRLMHLSASGQLGPAWSMVRSPSHALVNFELAVDAGGTAWVLWAESVPDSPATRWLGDTTLWLQRATPDGPAGMAEAVSPTIPTNEASLVVTKLALSPGGARAVAWAHSGSGFIRQMRVRAAAAGGAFGPATQVLDSVVMGGTSPTLRSLALDVDDRGRTAVAWSSNTTSPDRDVVGLALGGPAGLERLPWRAEPAAGVAGAFLWADQDALLLHRDPEQTATSQPYLRLTRLAPAAATPSWQAELTPRATQSWFLSGRPVSARLPAGQVAVAWAQSPRGPGGPSTELQRAVLSPDGRWTTVSLGPAYEDSAQFAPEGSSRLSLFWVTPQGRLWLSSAAPPR